MEESKLLQNFSYHWEKDGKWSCYVYGDEFRYIHKRSDDMVGYGRYQFEITPNVAELPVEMEYVKVKDICRCIRCSRPGDKFREDFNNACVCDRCYTAISSGNAEYGISINGFKTKLS